MTTTNTRHLAALGGIKHHHTRSEYSPGDGRRFAARLRHRAVRRSAAVVIANEIAEAREAALEDLLLTYSEARAAREAAEREALAALAAEYADLAAREEYADLAEYAAFADSDDVDQYAADVAEYVENLN